MMPKIIINPNQKQVILELVISLVRSSFTGTVLRSFNLEVFIASTSMKCRNKQLATSDNAQYLYQFMFHCFTTVQMLTLQIFPSVACSKMRRTTCSHMQDSPRSHNWIAPNRKSTLMNISSLLPIRDYNFYSTPQWPSSWPSGGFQRGMFHCSMLPSPNEMLDPWKADCHASSRLVCKTPWRHDRLNGDDPLFRYKTCPS